MAALVLGLLVGAAKSSFDAERAGYQQLTLDVVLLDRTLAHYGPEAVQAREQLRQTVTVMVNSLWPEEGSKSSGLEDERITTTGGALYDAVRALSPQNDSQRWLQGQATQELADLAKNRWQLAQRNDGSLPIPFLAVLAFWLFVLFTSFGLFSPQNITVVAVLFICALSVAGAVFLIVDLDQPFDGLVRISSIPLRDALAGLGK
ncbi:MAG: DUF4239 domain-containing protein [Planctomycetia bacterium]|nr:DUF4239 domain-containing protein [Planctomycetia bacterium]